MFKVRVIPCLDVKDGRVVKGINFVNLRDAGDPVEAATGSPASRRLMKLTPLTTRPSLTSRQGMTRTLNMSGRRLRFTQHGERCRRIEPAVIERAAGNGAGEFLRTRL